MRALDEIIFGDAISENFRAQQRQSNVGQQGREMRNALLNVVIDPLEDSLENSKLRNDVQLVAGNEFLEVDESQV